MKFVIGALLIMFTTSAMAAGSSAGYGMGGKFARFDPVVAEYNRSGELFRIEGHCQSACTLFLSIRNVRRAGRVVAVSRRQLPFIPVHV